MATYIVARVRKEWSADGTHRHIKGVCTENGTYYPRREVVDSITSGDTWKTNAGGYEAIIKPMSSCHWCAAGPYIRTNPDSTKKDNLEKLDEC